MERQKRCPGALGGAFHKKRHPAGFTLAELLVAIFLSSLVILGFASIFISVMRFHFQGMRRASVQASVATSLPTMVRDLRVTTQINSPSPPCPNGNCSGSTAQSGDSLAGCINYENSPLSGPRLLDTNFRMKVYQYCLDNCAPCGGRMFYYWIESSSLISCPPPVAPYNLCGDAPAIAGWNSMQITNLVFKDGSLPVFVRPANANNIVEMHYLVTDGTATIKIDTAMEALKPTRSWNP